MGKLYPKTNPDPQGPNTSHYEFASPTLLAAQPPTPKGKKAEQPDWPAIYEHLEGELQGLRNWRYSWWVYWQNLAQYILPRRYKWLITANTMWRGQPINNSIIDSTGTIAMQTCAAGLWTGLMSPSRPWFKMGIGLPWVDLDAEGKAWLEDTQMRIYVVLAQSNFYTQGAQMFQDVVTFGTAPMICYEDAEDVVRFYLPCSGEAYLGTSARFSNDTLFREFTLTVKQCVDWFGLRSCPADIQKLWQTGGGSLTTEVVVCHAIEPNFALEDRGRGKPISVVSGKFAYREVYWVRGMGKDGELSRKGFNERPFAVSRWSTVANDAYGRSPGMDALGDIKQLQLETMRKAEFIEKLVRPPMGADVAMKNEPSSILPGHITYTNTEGNRKGFWPLFEVQPQALAPMIQDIEKIQKRINDCFFVDLFMAISRMEGVQPRNELELNQRNLERLQVLGPFITLFEQEFADVTIRRVLSILERRRLLKPMPSSLRGIPLKIEYLSIMRLAQQSAEGLGIKDALTVGGQLSSAAKAAGLPDPLRIVDLDTIYRRYWELTNAPAEGLYTDDVVKKHDAARQQAHAQANAMQATPQAVAAAKQLSETQLGGNTALSALVGGGAAPGA